MEAFQAPWLGKYERKLRLNWPVEYLVAPEQRTCRIASDPAAKTHEVFAPSLESVKPGDVHFVDAVHELCHAALAERVDVSFATLYFSKKYSVLTGEAQEEFCAKARMLYWAWAHVDIWVDDLMTRELPDVARAERESFAVSVLTIAQSNPRALGTLEGIVALAISMAGDRRRGRQSSVPPVVKVALDSPATELLGLLGGMYADLPRLKFSRDEDLAILEQSVQQMIEALDLPIIARFVFEQDRMVWELDLDE